MKPKKEKYQFINFILGIFGRMLITADSNYRNVHVCWRDIDVSHSVDMAIIPIEGEKFGATRFITFGKGHRHPKFWRFGPVRRSLK